MAGGNLDDILQSLRLVFQKEYERGKTDTLNRIIGTINGAARKPKKKRSAQHAPRGTARALIMRVLGTKKTGARFPEIMAAAKTPAEKAVSAAAIRIELYNGKKARRYRNSNGTWSLPNGK